MSSRTWHTSADAQTLRANVVLQCGYRMLQIQTACLKCGMSATYESQTARSMLSVEALLRVEEDAVATAAGRALRTGASAPADETQEVEGQAMARKDKIMTKLMEYVGVTQL